MEWVEVTATSVEEAKDRALDQLGVDESDAEFEIVEEPRPGLFGRMRGEARVRARVRPTTPRPKADRRDRRKPAGKAEKADKAEKAEKAPKGEPKPRAKAAATTADTGPADEAAPATKAPRAAKGTARKAKAEPAPVAVETSEVTMASEADNPTDPQVLGQAVVTFLDGLVEAFGAEGRAEADVVDGDLEAHVDGTDLGLLIGPQGNTLQAIQELTRLATQRSTSDRSVRIRVDIGQYRERRREALVRFTNQVAEQVISSGAARSLEPMPAADRKVVHDAAQLISGVVTISEGEEPRRRVVIKPASA